MERQPISSSNIKSIGYADGEMHIEFTNGSVYSYTGPKAEQHYRGLLDAPSAGAYFAKNVRNCPITRSAKL